MAENISEKVFCTKCGHEIVKEEEEIICDKCGDTFCEECIIHCSVCENNLCYGCSGELFECDCGFIACDSCFKSQYVVSCPECGYSQKFGISDGDNFY